MRDASVSDPDLVRVLPQLAWLAWLGVLVAVVQLFDLVYMNIVPFLVWVLAAAIVMLMRRNETATAAHSPPHHLFKT